MQLKFPGASVSISDQDERAIKIRQGFAYSLNTDGRVVVSDQKTNIDREDLEAKLKSGIANTREIQTILLHLLKKSQCSSRRKKGFETHSACLV